MDNLRICFFFHRFDGGGAEKMTVLLANGLARLGHEVTILIRHDKGPVRRLLERCPNGASCAKTQGTCAGCGGCCGRGGSMCCCR